MGFSGKEVDKKCSLLYSSDGLGVNLFRREPIKRLMNKFLSLKSFTLLGAGPGVKKLMLKACSPCLIPSRQGRRIFQSEKAQAFTEYVLVFALVALLFGSVIGLWRGPLAIYLNRLAQAVATTR
jgi:hypothetical protein